jgi:hypothetical protein
MACSGTALLYLKYSKKTEFCGSAVVTPGPNSGSKALISLSGRTPVAYPDCSFPLYLQVGSRIFIHIALQPGAGLDLLFEVSVILLDTW